DFGNLVLRSAPAGFKYTLLNDAGEIDLQVDPLPAALNWNGSSNNSWDTSSNNWTPSTYAAGDPVVFGNGAANTSINITGGSVTPGSVTFNNDTGTSYTIGGGAIAGSTPLPLNGPGPVTPTGPN